jgi:hypothetical protein
MVYRWRCRHCEFTVWSANREQTAEEIKSHITDHYRNNISEDEFRIQWKCPYCDTNQQSHDKSEGLQSYRSHLFSHCEPLLESGVHVADDVDGTGEILVLSPVESTGTDNARIHFLSPCDIVVFVTTNPAKRIRLLQEELAEWPAWTVVLTTKDDPLAGLSGIDLGSVPLEIVQLDKRVGLDSLGKTVSRVLEEQESAEGKISFEFDILPEIINKFDLQQVFKFLHVLNARLEDADALSHYYFDPRTQSESSINVLDQVFDLKISADDRIFTAESD